MNIVFIVQARIASTRLLVKVLKKICGKTVLEYVREIKDLHRKMGMNDRVWISDIILYEIKPIFKELQEEINCSL